LACEHFVKPEYVATERSNNEAGSRALSKFEREARKICLVTRDTKR